MEALLPVPPRWWSEARCAERVMAPSHLSVGQRADLRVLFQAHREDLAVHPLLHGGVAQAAGLVAGMVFTVGGDQCQGFSLIY